MVSTVLTREPLFGVRGTDEPLARHELAPTVIRLDGEYDSATTHCLTDTLVRAICRDHADLIVDLSGVTFIGAATIGQLLRARNFLRRQSRSLTLRSPSRCAERVLVLCGLTDLVAPVALPSPRSTDS